MEEHQSDEPLTDNTRAFLLAEHALLRGEIGNLVRQLVQNEATALIASGAIWSWLATHDWKPASIPVLFIPAALSILFWLRWRTLERGISRIAAYLQRVETRLNLQGMGWETHLTQTRVGLLELLAPPSSVEGRLARAHASVNQFDLYHWTFWGALLLGNLMLAFVYVATSGGSELLR